MVLITDGTNCITMSVRETEQHHRFPFTEQINPSLLSVTRLILTYSLLVVLLSFGDSNIPASKVSRIFDIDVSRMVNN